MPAPSSDPISPLVEPLEQRRHLAASAELLDGVLTIVGTHKADVIDLTVDSAFRQQVTVRLNGDVSRFTLTDVDGISIQAGQGNDVVHIDNGKVHLDQPTTIFGSGGNDTIRGGKGKDRIYGGAGADVLKGGDARDIIYGEGGNDLIDGEQGNDALDGGTANDTITGGLGIDRLFGGNGKDVLHSKDGAVDSVDGGNDSDTATDHDDVLDNLTNVENS
jgi:Ca2+-binding RTX toxin-like protein